MFQTFLAGFGGVGGACALITLLLRIWPGALDALATGLYSHVRPERLPYDSPLSQHFAKTRQLGERTVGFHHHTQRGSPMRHPVREEPHG